MNLSKEIEKLKREYVSLSSEEERKEFDIKFRNNISSKKEDEKLEFAYAFINSAKADSRRIREFCEEIKINKNGYPLHFIEEEIQELSFA